MSCSGGWVVIKCYCGVGVVLYNGAASGFFV